MRPPASNPLASPLDSVSPEALAAEASVPVTRVVTPQFALLLVTQGVFGLAFSLFFLLPKFMAQELSASASQIGLASALAPAAGVLAIPFVATAVERFGRRRLVVLGAILTGLSAVGFLWVDRVGWLLYALRCVQGCAFAFAFNAAATLAADLAPKERLSQALGWFGVAFLATNAAAPLVAEPLADWLGWRTVFGFAALMATGAALLATRLPDRGRPQTPKQPGDASAWSALRQPRILAVFFGSLVAGVGLGTVFTFHQPFALLRGAERVGGFFLGYTAAAVFVRILLGSLADRLGRVRVGRMALIGYALVVACMSQLTPDLLIPFGIAFGFVHGLMYPALNAVAVESATDAQRGTVMTFYNGSFNLGVAGASLSLGHVAERWGYPPVFWITAGVVGLAFPALLFVRESGRERG